MFGDDGTDPTDIVDIDREISGEVAVAHFGRPPIECLTFTEPGREAPELIYL